MIREELRNQSEIVHGIFTVAVRDKSDATRDVTGCVEFVEPSSRQANVPLSFIPVSQGIKARTF